MHTALYANSPPTTARESSLHQAPLEDEHKLQARQHALQKTKSQDDMAQDTVEKTCLSTDMEKWNQQQWHIHPQSLWEQKNSNYDKVKLIACETNTRTVQKIRDVQSRIQNYDKKYCNDHAVMIAIGCSPEDPNFGFPELKDEDLYTNNVNEPHNLGDVKKVEGWTGLLWEHDSQRGGRLCHGLKKSKFWDKSSEEFRCAIQGFNKMENIWTSLAKDHKNEPGKSAYASKVANMYQQIESNAQQQYTKVGGNWLKEGVSLAQHIKSEHPDPKIRGRKCRKAVKVRCSHKLNPRALDIRLRNFNEETYEILGRDEKSLSGRVTNSGGESNPEQL
ncbi:hypothetical protein C8R45DRAFT_945755 [Mycena sanguinolenta]|nr:hypothetical protein C8R45DRAFT_945755 [Mycena sanguinolenta]